MNNWSFRSAGRELALGRKDNSVVFFDLPSGQLLRRWPEYPGAGWILAYSPDGVRLAIQNGDTIKILASDSGRLLATLSHPAYAHHVAWNPRRPNILAVACEDGVIYVWNVDTSQQTAVLRGTMSTGLIIAFHPGGELLAGRAWERMLRLWDTRTGRQVLSQPSAWSATLEFDRSGRWLSVDAAPEKASVLELAGLDECRTLIGEPFNENDRYGSLAIDTAGKRAVTTGSTITVWDLPTGAVLATLPVTGSADRALFDASGAVLTEGPLLLRWPVTEAPGEPGVATTIGPPKMLQPKGTQTDFASSQDRWPLFETTTWIPKVGLHRGTAGRLAVAPDSRTVAYDDGAGTIILTEAETGQELARLKGPEQARLGPAAFTPDGSQLVTTLIGRPYLRVWDLRKIRRKLAELKLDWGPPASFDSIDAPGSFPPIPKPFRVDRGQLDSWLKQENDVRPLDPGFPADVFAPP